MTMKASRGALTALGLALAVTLAGAAYGAQQRAPQPTPLPAPPQANQVQPQPNRGADQFDRQADRRGNRGNRADRLERRLDFLHYELRITPQQQRAWDNFATALRESAQDVRGRMAARNDGRRGGPDGRNARRNDDNGRGVASVIDRLERRQDRLAMRSERLDHLIGTLRPLYTALNDDQKRTADRLLLQARDRFGRGGRDGDRRGGFGRGRFQGRFGQDRFGQNGFETEDGPASFAEDEPSDREYR